MKNHLELTNEEKLALIEKIKSYPRPAAFAKPEETTTSTTTTNP